MLRVLLLSVFLLLVTPVMAEAQIFPGGPEQIVPIECKDPAGCGTCEFVKLINNSIDLVVWFASMAALFMFMYAGFRMVTSQGNVDSWTKAKETAKNVLIGYFVLLASFLIIDTLLAMLLPDNSSVLNWREIECIYPTESVWNDDLDPLADEDTVSEIGDLVVGGGSDNVNGGYGGTTSGGRGTAQCANDNPNCSVSFLMSLGLSSTQANVMSCIAVTENAGNAVGCSGTGPCGTFQITMTNWRIYTEGSNADYPECSAANFSGNITSAQNNGQCNARVMTSMVRDSGYQPWTGANTNPNDSVPDGPWNPNARLCVQNYSNASDPTPKGF